MSTAMCVVVASLAVATPASASEWSYRASLYGWFAGLEGSIGVAGLVEEPLEATFEDLAGFLDFAVAGAFEARNERTFLHADVSYTGLGSTREAEVARQTVDVDLDLDQWIIEVDGGYRLSRSFAVLLAGRYYVIDTGSTFTAPGAEKTVDFNENWFDFFVGARYERAIGPKWLFALRSDVGGGGSDLAWFGQAVLGYRVSDRWELAAAWRVLGIDYDGDDGRGFRYDVTQSGPGLSLAHVF